MTNFVAKIEAKSKNSPSLTPFGKKLTDLKEIGYIDYGSFTDILLYSPRQRRFFLEISKQKALQWLSKNRDRLKDYADISEVTRHLPFVADEKDAGKKSR